VQPLILPLVLAILGYLSGDLNGAAAHLAVQMRPMPENLAKIRHCRKSCQDSASDPNNK
jgi:hypothetical protein